MSFNLGVKRLCGDIFFMLGLKTSLYYRICWAIITPAVMAAILVYTLVEYKPLQYNGYTYTDGLYSEILFELFLFLNFIFLSFKLLVGVYRHLEFCNWSSGEFMRLLSNQKELCYTDLCPHLSRSQIGDQ